MTVPQQEWQLDLLTTSWQRYSQTQRGWRAGMLMGDVALTLLAEKLVEDFYDADRVPIIQSEEIKDDIKEQLKALVPKDKWNLLFKRFRR